MEPVHSQLAAVSGETVSPAYITDRNAFAEYVRRDDRTLLVCRRTNDIDEGILEVTDPADLDRTDWEVLGFSLFGQYNREAFDELVSVSVDHVLDVTPLRPDDFPLSTLKVIAVRPDAQGRGLGSRISTEAATRLLVKPPAVTMVWLRDNPANRKLAETYSEFVMARFEDYFPDDWECPECGYENDCSCTVELYGWFTDGRDAEVGGVEDPVVEPAVRVADD